MIAVTIHDNPYDPYFSRKKFRFDQGASIAKMVETYRLGEDERPFIALVEGEAYGRSEWEYIPPNDSLVQFVFVQQGGGGKGGKNPAAMIAMLALTVFTAGAGLGAQAAVGVGLGTTTTTLAPVVVTTTTLTAAGSVFAAAVNTSILALGGLLINAVLPPDLPKGSQTPEPSYSVNLRGNQVRLGEPIEVQFGRTLAFPSFAAQPYREYVDSGRTDRGDMVVGDQKFFALYCWGKGRVDVEEYQVLGADVARYGDQIKITKYEPGEPVTAFPFSVLTHPSVVDLTLEATNIRPEAEIVTDEDDPEYDPLATPTDNLVLHTGFITSATQDTVAGTVTITVSGAIFGATDALAGEHLWFQRDTDSPFKGRDFWATIVASTSTTITYHAPADTYLGKASAVPKLLDSGEVWPFSVERFRNWTDSYRINLDAEQPLVNKIGYDIIAPEGLKFTDKEGDTKDVSFGLRTEIRPITAGTGTPTGPWVPLTYYDSGDTDGRLTTNQIPAHATSGLSLLTFPGSKQNPWSTPSVVYEEASTDVWTRRINFPLRETRKFDVPEGRYEVRMRRSTVFFEFKNPGKVQQTVVWAGLRGYGVASDGSNVWEHETMIAVELTATNNINDSTIKEFGVLGTAMREDYIGVVDPGDMPDNPLTTHVVTGANIIGHPYLSQVFKVGIGTEFRRKGKITLAGYDEDQNNGTFTIYKVDDDNVYIQTELVDETGDVSKTAASSLVTMEVPEALREAILDGALVTLAGATATGGLTTGTLNAEHECLIVGATTLEFDAGTTATSATTGGGTGISYTVAEWTDVHPTRTISSAMIGAATNTDYGGKVPMADIDLEGFREKEATWSNRDRWLDEGETQWNPTPILDRFDYRFETREPILDALVSMARAGRSRAVTPGGVLTVERDEPKPTSDAVFDTRTIVPGSVSMTYLFPGGDGDTPDHLIVEFFDEASWDKNEVTITDDVSETAPGNRASRLNLRGVVQYKHAWREGQYEFGSSLKRRSIIGLEVDAEGLLPRLLSRCKIVGVLSNWGQYGQVIGYEERETDASIFTSKPLDWGSGVPGPSTHVMQLKTYLGTASSSGLFYVTRGAQDNEVVFTGALDQEAIGLWLADGVSREATGYSFGLAGKHNKDILVTAIRPSTRNRVGIEAVNYIEAGVYDRDGDLDFDPPSDVEFLDREEPAPDTLGLKATLGGTFRAPVIYMSWLPTPGARAYDVERKDGVWTKVARTTGTTFEVTLAAPTLEEVVQEEDFTVGLCVNNGLETLIARNSGTETTAWTNGQFDGMFIRFRDGAWKDRAYQIRRTVASPDGTTQGIYLADSLSPLPKANTDHYDIYQMEYLPIEVGVRTVNRLAGSRAEFSVPMSGVVDLPGTLEVTSEGEVLISRGAGTPGPEADGGFTRVSLVRFDAEGNGFFRGRVYQEQTNNDPFAVMLGVEARRYGTSLTEFDLPATPRSADSLMVFVQDQLMKRVASAPGVNEYTLSGSRITMGMDITTETIHVMMVGDSATTDLDGLHMGVACTFTPGTSTATIPFTPERPEEIVPFLNGDYLSNVHGGTPGVGEFTISGTTLTLGDTLTIYDTLVVVGVESGAATDALNVRCIQWTGERLPLVPLFPVQTIVLEGGTPRWYAQSPAVGEFALTGSPAIDIFWGGVAPITGAVKYAIAQVS